MKKQTLKKYKMILMLSGIILLFAGCNKKETFVLPTAMPEQVELHIAVKDTEVPITPTPSPEPTPTPANNDGAPTFTPKITFVPLPQDEHTPDSNGKTPTPSPAWATPYPVWTGEPTVNNDESVDVVTFSSDTDIFRKQTLKGGKLGTAKAERIYRILSETDKAYEVLYNGENGFVAKDVNTAELVDLNQKEMMEYKIGTLNVHSVCNDERMNKVAKIMKESNADVIGIQEVVRNTTAGNYEDWLDKLAKASDYPYYVFCKTMNYNGGQYGIAILSKYPIVDHATWKLDVAKGKEVRYLEYARILMEKGAISVFNTHLCASNMHLKSINVASFVQMLEATRIKKYTVTGDFNCSPPRIYHYKKDINFANIAKNTFGDGSRPKIIDNVLYTEGIVVPHVEIIDTSKTGATDHKMLVATCYQLITK